MMKNTEIDLYTSLKAYGQSDIYPFHMPGHKRNPDFLDFGQTVKMDITEIDGFDNMHHARGIIDQAQRRAARLYGADETWFLVNGSSCGLISAILGSCKRGGRILLARNCHKSVYNAIEMGHLKPVYIYPELVTPLQIYASIKPEQIQKKLDEYSDIEAVVITSPTYEGVVSDIETIAQIVHRYRIPLIVDEAHGAHLGFAKGFPQTAVRLGADVVIQSAHKTLPSLTQTSVIHLNGDIANRKKIRKYYDYLQTTSPSYIMMASLDHCMSVLEAEGEKHFDRFRQMLQTFYESVSSYSHIKVMRPQDMAIEGIYDWDMSKLVISGRRVSACGDWLYHILLEIYHLQMEMVSRDYVLGMTSFCDRPEGFERLADALRQIDAMDVESFPAYQKIHLKMIEGQPDICAGEAVDKPVEKIDFSKAMGRLSAEYAYVYPPGIPFLVPGERIQDSHLTLLHNYAKSGLEIEGLEDPDLKTIKVLKIDESVGNR